MNEQVAPSLDEVLARITVRGTDPGVVSDYAMGLIAARSKHRRRLGGAAAVLAVAAATAFAVMGNSGPNTDEVVTPADSATSTLKPAGSDEKSVTTAPASIVPSTTMAIVTTPTVTTTKPGFIPAPTIAPAAPTEPVTPVPTTSVDRPGSATLAVTSGVAGELLDLRFEFNDPDGPGVAPVMWIDTDEPGTAEPTPDPGVGGSCSGGPGTTARLHEPVQFASTGQRRVWVTVRYCNAFASVFSTTVDVAAPKFGDGPGRAVMAGIPNTPNLHVGARWEFLPTGAVETLEVEPADDEHTHRLEPDGGFPVLGVVIVLPANSSGRLILTTGGPDPRTYKGDVTLTDPGRPVRMQPQA